MSVEIQQVEYAADPRAMTRRVPIATLVKRDGHFELIERDFAEWGGRASVATRRHVALVLASLRSKIAHGAEPTPPSAQVFFRRVVGAEAEALEQRQAR